MSALPEWWRQAPSEKDCCLSSAESTHARQRGAGRARVRTWAPEMRAQRSSWGSWTDFVAISRKLFITVNASSNKSSSRAFESFGAGSRVDQTMSESKGRGRQPEGSDAFARGRPARQLEHSSELNQWTDLCRLLLVEKVCRPASRHAQWTSRREAVGGAEGELGVVLLRGCGTDNLLRAEAMLDSRLNRVDSTTGDPWATTSRVERPMRAD